MKQAVILAAGLGTRLEGAAQGLPKCLQRVGDRTILEIQLDILAAVGIDSVCVVVGHLREDVERFAAQRPGVDLVLNPRFAETNSLYSFWLAREWIRGPFLVLNGDVIAHPDVFHRVLAVEGSALAFDGGSGLDAEHMKIRARGSFLRGISKDLGGKSIEGENVGLMQFDQHGACNVLAAAAELVAAGGENDWFPAAVDHCLPAVPVRCVDVQGLPWIEVDFPEDLEAAREVVWPAVRELVPPRAVAGVHAVSPAPAVAASKARISRVV